MDAETTQPGCEMIRDFPVQPLAGWQPSRKVYMPSLKKMLKVPLALAVAASMAVPAVPQEPQGPALKRTVNLVNLFATVRDKNKRIVGDLKQSDFKVFEDTQEQQIAFFSKEVTLPITLGLLIDTSGSEQNRLGAEQEAASQFLEPIRMWICWRILPTIAEWCSGQLTRRGLER